MSANPLQVAFHQGDELVGQHNALVDQYNSILQAQNGNIRDAQKAYDTGDYGQVTGSYQLFNSYQTQIDQLSPKIKGLESQIQSVIAGIPDLITTYGNGYAEGKPITVFVDPTDPASLKSLPGKKSGSSQPNMAHVLIGALLAYYYFWRSFA